MRTLVVPFITNRAVLIGLMVCTHAPTVAPVVIALDVSSPAFSSCKFAAIPPTDAAAWIVPMPGTIVPKVAIAHGTAAPERAPAANTVLAPSTVPVTAFLQEEVIASATLRKTIVFSMRRVFLHDAVNFLPADQLNDFPHPHVPDALGLSNTNRLPMTSLV